MSKNTESPSNSPENVIDGSAKFAEYSRKVKTKKLISRLAFAGVVTVAVAASLKYISTPVPEWADDSEDV